jgi:predicted nucleic acid-binding protein
MNYRPRVCLDSSILVKWFKVEEESGEALKLRRWAEEARIKLAISAIVLSESARALKKGGFDNDEIYRISDMFDAFISLCGVEVVPVDWLIIKSAQSLVIEYNLYSADAIHVSTAVLTESDFFVSKDQHHFKESLKSHLAEKNVRVLRLSEIEEISLSL